MPQVMETAKRVIQKVAGTQAVRIRDNVPEEEKISRALSLLLESEVPQGSPLAEYKGVLACIVVAWNISLLDADTRAGEILSFIETLGEVEGATQRHLTGQIERLITRKQVLFPEDRRTILSWDLRFQGGYVRIAAAALAQD
jgi:hypothetical protein